MKLFFLVVITVFIHKTYAQYAPAVGLPGCDAIYKDSSIVNNWLNFNDEFTIHRGWKNIADTTLGKVTFGTDSAIVGKAGNLKVLSLGDKGSVLIKLNNFEIKDSSGADFAIFENAFDNFFLELATVALSSDGITFYQFPCISNTQDTLQINGFGQLQADKLFNLAGKYKIGYGTPFDISSMDSVYPNLPNTFRYIKITDIVGSINPLYATTDYNGNNINDPFPTPFITGGFDLDAIGFINTKAFVNSIYKKESNNIQVYPNPTQDYLYIKGVTTEKEITLLSINGLTLVKTNCNKLDISLFEKGIYYLKIKTEDAIFVKKIIKY